MMYYDLDETCNYAKGGGAVQSVVPLFDVDPKDTSDLSSKEGRRT
jgi:hypothetical protein